MALVPCECDLIAGMGQLQTSLSHKCCPPIRMVWHTIVSSVHRSDGLLLWQQPCLLSACRAAVISCGTSARLKDRLAQTANASFRSSSWGSRAPHAVHLQDR